MPAQAGISPEETRISEVQPELSKLAITRSADAILSLLQEYTEKLKAAHDEFQGRQQQIFVVGIVCYGFLLVGEVVIDGWLPALRPAHSPWPEMLEFFVALLLPLTLYLRLQQPRQRETNKRITALSRRLEPLLQWATQIYEHAERDEVRRLELSLRLKEAESYTRFLKKDVLK